MDEFTRRVAELEALLDNYRGTCQDCGRDGVLLEFSGTYDGMETVCLLDREECERLKTERLRREGEEHRARVAAGDPLAVMADNLGRTMLNLARKPPVQFEPGTKVEFARYSTSSTAPTTEG